jgi:Predicted membrane protein
MTSAAGWLLAYMAGMSLALMGMMGADKRRARLGRRRISERRLLVWALLGGAAGGWVGMRLFRHKTKHRMFALGLPALTALHAALLAAVFRWAGG